jgi:protoporphyrinogen oxidase
LQALGALLIAGNVLPMESLAATCAPRYKVSQWTGDDFTIGHKFRMNESPNFSDTPEKTYDFVIVGGGVSGLTCAHYLRDHDILLLEQYDQLGGNSRGGSYRGIDYSYGAAYIDTVEGIYGKLYSELGISPRQIPAGDNTYYWDKKFDRGGMGNSGALFGHFKRLAKETEAAMKSMPAEDDAPNVSIPEVARLDAMPFSELLKGYPPQFVALIDSICRSSSCGGTQSISALLGLSLMEDLTSTNYVFEGGNSAISKGLVRSLEKGGAGRLQRGTFVWEVALNDTGATIKYTDQKGAPHTVACKHAIIATPALVAWRQLKNLDNATRARLMQFKYGSYLVANCLLNKQIFKQAYDNFFNPALGFADVTMADTPYMLAGKYKPTMGSVLTIYQPYEPGSQGRPLLLVGDRQKFAKQIHDGLKQFLTTLDNHLEEIVLTRWGHAISVPSPGYYSRLAKLMNSYSGPYSLAHSSFYGLQCAEAAIRGANTAAARAKKASTTASVLVSNSFV